MTLPEREVVVELNIKINDEAMEVVLDEETLAYKHGDDLDLFSALNLVENILKGLRIDYRISTLED